MTQQPWGQQGWNQPRPQWNQGQFGGHYGPGQQPQWGAPGAGQRPVGYPAPGGFPAPQGFPQQPQGFPQQQGYPQPGGFQQPQYPAPGGFQQPRKKSPLGKILLALGALCALAVIGLIGLSLLGGGGGPGQQDQGYKNEGYKAPPADLNPPELPQPETYEEATTMLEQNAIYKQQIDVPTRCEPPAFSVGGGSTAQAQSYLNELTVCLMKVWEPPMKAAGFQMPRPSVTVYTSQITTKCGKAPTRNAFYCGGDQQVYFAVDVLTILPSQYRTHRLALDAVLAHEFGHAVQGRTGILIASGAWEQKLGKPSGLIYSRRLETQADCFSGLFFDSVAQSRNITDGEKEDLAQISFNIGDDILSGDPNVVGNHGHGKSREFWFKRGLTNTSIGQCNTYTAPDSQVE